MKEMKFMKNPRTLSLVEATLEFEAFKISMLFMDIDDLIDCVGMTLEEYCSQENITIKEI